MGKRVLVFVLCLLLLAGCAGPGDEASMQMGQTPESVDLQQAAVDDSRLTAEDAEQALEEQQRLEAELEQSNRDTKPLETINAYISSYGIDTEGKLDSEGRYLAYTGGTMELDIFLQAVGLQEEGVAIMLFLDGQPQPYTLTETGEYAYQHTVYPSDSCSVGVSFVPVTGSAGDVLELCILYFPSYNCTATPDAVRPWYQEDGAKFMMVRVKMKDTPGTCRIPQRTERIIQWDMNAASATPTDGGNYWNAYFNGRASNRLIKDFDTAQPLDFSFFMHCNSEDAYALTIYLDGEPILHNAWKLAEYSEYTMTGQIDCSGLAGEHIVFAILLNRDYWGDGIGWESYPDENSMKVIHLDMGE